MTGSSKKTKVEQMGDSAETMAHQMKKQGESTREIATALSRVFNDNISHQAVSNYFDKNKERFEKMGEKNAQELEKQKHEKLTDLQNTLERVQGLLENILGQFEDEGVDKQDINYVTQLSKEIRKHVKTTEKYIEKTYPDAAEVNNTQINMNVENKTKIAMKISKHLDKLEDEGVITVHKPDKIGSMAEQD